MLGLALEGVEELVERAQRAVVDAQQPVPGRDPGDLWDLPVGGSREA